MREDIEQELWDAAFLVSDGPWADLLVRAAVEIESLRAQLKEQEKPGPQEAPEVDP